MQPKHLYTLTCDHVIQDRQDKHSYIGVFQHVFLDKLPGALPQFWVVSVLQAWALAGAALQIKIVSPGSAWHRGIVDSRVPPEARPAGSTAYSTATVAIAVEEMRFEQEGLHEIQVLLDGNKVGGCFFQVLLQESQR